MPTLANYMQFDGRYWDTGVIRNALDYQGATAPHTGEPYTEALLLGVSGGVTFGYFTFRYEGYDPQVNILTRNTFEPMETIFDRLAIPRESFQTTQPDKARKTLIEALEDGHVPIIWPDMFLLPYNGLPYDEMNWGPLPVVIYGYESDLNEAYLADRSFVGLTVPADVLDASRARVKSDKHRMLIIEHPDASRLPEAVRRGIQDCIALMTEKPPRGSTKNFGLTGLKHWADMLEKTTKASWSCEYATGRDLLSALTTAFYFAGLGFGKTMQAERDTYADFLMEAAAILGNTALENVAARYRMAGRAWNGLLCALLPEDVDMLKQARYLIEQKHELFIEKGGAATDTLRKLEQDLTALKDEAEADFPMTEAEITDLRAEIRRHVLLVHDAEEEAVLALKVAMA